MLKNAALQVGAQSMTAPLRAVVMRRPGAAFRGADPQKWHYGPGFDADKAAAQYEVFAGMIADAGAEIFWLGDDDASSDGIFTHDPSLVGDRGAILLAMGKDLRRDEPASHGLLYERLGVPVIGRIEAPGTVEGGDCIWLDSQTLAVGRGVRTNQAGIEQLAAILRPLDVTVLGFDLPLWGGEAACLHLMSVISPLDDDLALVHSPLIPVALYRLMRDLSIGMVECCPNEFAASNGLSLNVLALAPRRIIAIAGYPETSKRMAAHGCNVETFKADALCIPCEGGPTCLTRPLRRG